MTVVKINAITVPENSGDELAKRFAKRAGSVDGFDGFQGFELLQPTDGRNTWLVVTKWRDEASFEAWLARKEFGAAHGQQAPSGNPKDNPQPTEADNNPHKEKPVGMSAELWSFNVTNLDAHT